MFSSASASPANRPPPTVNLLWLDSLQGSGIRPGLGRMRALLRQLGRPQHACPSVIVAGTNGKGSTSATLTAILHAAGYRTGLYTSPHLVDIRERWRIAEEPIAPELLEESIDALRAGADAAGITPTYFEALTILAFIAFHHAACEVVVLEVGMGGRLDATNVVRPVASLITPIGFDHMEFLGKTIRKIAAEKAGVIHRGAIVLTNNREPAVLDVLRRRAAKFGNEFHVSSPDERASETPLTGAFQLDNVSLAIGAAEALAPRFPRITAEAIRRGVAATKWRGRLERFEHGATRIWIDGCHNAHAVRAVRPFIETEIDGPRLLVFGVMGDKDVDEMTNELFPLFDRIITCEPYPPRSADAETLAEKARARGIEVVAEKDPRSALARAVGSGQRSIFVGGSLYLAGTAIEYFDALREQQ
ncbi:MAG: dihydrofolate synthase / folylpolyglutamate synthase [Acidobacteriota bacterium]|jgi:dihydrofolate synthase/folylpolyglutamate synthase|nr:dihydrofolate synthase / folylpolyglutamate synthase [Acidobacteriota bacterium]